MVIHMVSKSET